MTRVLVPIDPQDPDLTRSAIEKVVRMHQQDPLSVRLLSVQPRVSGHVAMFFDAQELQQLQREAAAEELAPAERLLDLAGVPYTSLVQIGRSAETIVTAARETGCDRIVFGDERPGLASRVFGSLAQQVRHVLGRTAGADLKVLGS